MFCKGLPFFIDLDLGIDLSNIVLKDPETLFVDRDPYWPSYTL